MSADVVMLCLCQTLLRRYRVRYTELYEHLPWLTNSAEGLVTLTHRDEVRIIITEMDFINLDLLCSGVPDGL